MVRASTAAYRGMRAAAAETNRPNPPDTRATGGLTTTKRENVVAKLRKRQSYSETAAFAGSAEGNLVEPIGIEPTTS